MSQQKRGGQGRGSGPRRDVQGQTPGQETSRPPSSTYTEAQQQSGPSSQTPPQQQQSWGQTRPPRPQQQQQSWGPPQGQTRPGAQQQPRGPPQGQTRPRAQQQPSGQPPGFGQPRGPPPRQPTSAWGQPGPSGAQPSPPVQEVESFQSMMGDVSERMGSVSLSQSTISLESEAPSTRLPPLQGTNFGDRLPRRPDSGGKQGRKIQIITNCATLNITQPIPFFLYDIKIKNCGFVGDMPPTPAGKTPSDGTKKEFKTRKEKNAIFSCLQKTYPTELGQGLIYDRQAVIFAVRSVPEKTYVVEIDDEEYPGRRFKLEVTIKNTGSGATLHELIKFVNPKEDENNIPQEAIRLLNTFFHCFLTSGERGMLSHGRTTVLNPDTLPLQLTQGIFCYAEGFNVSVRPQRWTMRLVIDKTQTAFHEQGPLHELISKILRRPYLNLNPRDIPTLSKHLRQLRVEASHFKTTAGKPYSRKFTITCIADKMANQLMIPDLRQSVYQYICTTYPHVASLIKPQSPCVQYGAKKSWLPVELCTVVPYQAAPGKDSRIVQDIIKKAAIPPLQRRDQITRFLTTVITNFKAESSKYLMNNVINIEAKLVEAEARVLSKRRIAYADNRSEEVEGDWRLDGRKFFECARSRHNPQLKWAVIFTDDRAMKMRSQGINDIVITGRKLGLQIEEKPRECFIYPRQWQETFDQLVQEKYDFAIIIHSFNDDYGEIKRLGDQDWGIVTQVIKSDTWTKRMNPMTATNIWLKLNGKLGGINWSLSPSRPPGYFMKECIMVFGADVTHPSPGSQAGGKKIGLSIAAVVASMNYEMTKYVAKVCQQPSKLGSESKEYVEIIFDMKNLFKQLLMHFYTTNNQRKPSSILFYRDGVSEGQFRHVRNNEIKAIQDACIDLEKDGAYKPGITFVVVQKRHNMRFFTKEVAPPEDPNYRKKGNLPPGAVIDTEVCHPREFDFYLNSHRAIQGTSKAAHYHVLWDDNNWGSDDLQNMTYLLCHGYMRCARSVSYPAPTYYAHLAAYRGRAWLGVSDSDSSDGSASISRRTTTLHERIEDTMFFL